MTEHLSSPVPQFRARGSRRLSLETSSRYWPPVSLRSARGTTMEDNPLMAGHTAAGTVTLAKTLNCGKELHQRAEAAATVQPERLHTGPCQHPAPGRAPEPAPQARAYSRLGGSGLVLAWPDNVRLGPRTSSPGGRAHLARARPDSDTATKSR